MERYTVSLDDFIKYLIKKWYVIVVCVILGIGTFAVSVFMFGQKIVIPQSDKYAGLKEEEDEFEKYIDNAPLMKIDATNVYEKVIYLSNVSNRENLKSYIESGNVWRDYPGEDFFNYFTDHITWYDSTAQTAEIKIQYYEELECQKLAEYLCNKILEEDNSVSILLGDGYISNDEEIANVQSWYRNRLNDVKGQLEYTAAGYTIEVSILAAAVLGILVGICGSVGCLLVTFCIAGKEKCK